jgi:hypothetical protein
MNNVIIIDCFYSFIKKINNFEINLEVSHFQFAFGFNEAYSNNLILVQIFYIELSDVHKDVFLEVK